MRLPNNGGHLDISSPNEASRTGNGLYITELLHKRVSWCGGLNGNGPHRLIVSGTVRICGLVEVDVVLLEKVYHLGWTLRF